MSSSLQQSQPKPQLQPQPPPQQQQPDLVYPNNVNKQPSSSSHHSNGSFGAVFIVLAVIIVVSAIACFLGRLCNRRLQNSKPSKQSSTHNFRPNKEASGGAGSGGERRHMEFGNSNNNNKHSFRAPKDVDIEFGFDKKMQNGNGNGSGRSESSRGHMSNNHHKKPAFNLNGDHQQHQMKGHDQMQQPVGDHVGSGEPRATG